MIILAALAAYAAACARLARDPDNPDHVRRWELAGRPAVDVAGGNVVAGRALYDTIAESTGDFAWLNQEMGEGGPSILSIFAARLVAQ